MHESAKAEAQRRRAHWKAKLGALRAALREARRELAPRIKDVRAACRGARRGLAFRIKEVRAELHRLIHVERKALAKRCKNEPREVREAGLAQIAQLARDYATTRGYVAELRRGGEFKIKGLKSPLHTMSVREQSEQSDHEVEVNLPPELVPAWQAKKHEIHATPRSSRTDVFLSWAHDHPADAASYYYVEAENVAELEREEKRAAAEHERAKEKTRAKRPKRERAPVVDVVDEWGGDPIIPARAQRTPSTLEQTSTGSTSSPTKRIEYGAVPNTNTIRGGWVPMVWEDGRPVSGTFRTTSALDEGQARELAYTDARERASRYVGDWQIETVARPSSSPTSSPTPAKKKRAKKAPKTPAHMLTRQQENALEEYARGWQGARREIRDDGWTIEIAVKYLNAMRDQGDGRPSMHPYTRGFDDAIRAFVVGDSLDAFAPNGMPRYRSSFLGALIDGEALEPTEADPTWGPDSEPPF